MAFSEFDFRQVLKDIETYLGYLRGNEHAWAYLLETSREFSGVPEGQHGGVYHLFQLKDDYRFPCPDGQFKVDPTPRAKFTFFTPVDARYSESDLDYFVTSVQHGADKAWQDGVAWANGVADYAASVCDQFVKPNVSSLVDTVLAMQREVVEPLTDNPNDDWANLGALNTRWTGRGAAAFNEFYLNFNDTLGRSGAFTHMVNVGFASATKLISGTQFGAQFFVESIRDSLKAQLGQWVEDLGQPYDPSPPPAWIADVYKIGKDTLSVAADLIPVVANVKKKVEDIGQKGSDVQALLKDVENVSGKSILPKKDKDVPLKTAEEIYTGLTKTLYDDYYTAYTKAMDALQAGGTGSDVPDPGDLTTAAFSGDGVVAQMQEDKKQGDWGLPDVPNQSLKGNGDAY